VNECDFTRRVGVRMCVGIGLTPVGGPTGVCDADVVSVGGGGLFCDEVKAVGFFTLGGVFGYLRDSREIER
jgi:hypothetical protein